MRRALRLAGLLALALCLVVADAQKPPNGPVKGDLSPEQMKEREALLALKAAISTNGWGQSKIRSWKLKGGPCTPKPWSHVTCAGGRVTGLTLSNLGIQGTLPLKLRQLNALTDLKMDGNKFTGPIPTGWADPRFFLAMRNLDLHDNLLEGALPSKAWNKKGAFRSLETLDLSQNNFSGGLPVGWLAGNKVFAKLRLLDLSSNKLGTTDGTTVATKAQWCPTDSTYGAASASYGWCPTAEPLAGTFPNLITLDLSNNGFDGPLDNAWPKMFPNLQYLLIANNKLYVEEAKPSVLASEWTRATYPIAFPQLNSLVLYPGNDNICNVPAQKEDDAFQLDGYTPVNTDATYRIMDTESEEYTKDNPWACPGPKTADNTPTNVGKDASGSTLKVTWSAPAAIAGAPAMDQVVFGYKVTVEVASAEDDSYSVLSGWNGKLFRTYTFAAGAEDGSLAKVDEAAGLFEVDTGIDTAAYPGFKVYVAAYNVDGDESSAAVPAGQQ